MIRTVQNEADHRERARFTLVESGGRRTWGTCAEAEGLFGEPRYGTYELFGWTPEAGGPRGWAGRSVWLVPDDVALGPWLLEDARTLEYDPGPGGLVITGLDDYEGPPDGRRGRVRLHDGRRWLGTCREFTRVLPARHQAVPLVLRGLAPSEGLRTRLARGTRSARDLDHAVLEIRDDGGVLLTDRSVGARIAAWRPSSRGTGLIDLELDGDLCAPVPAHARPVWEQWLAGLSDAPGSWARLDTRRRDAWLDLARDRACRRTHRDRPAGHAYELDGRNITDQPGLYLALGEAVNGPGGYFGGCLDGLVDCLRGTFGCTTPATILWRDAYIARTHLSHTLGPGGQPRDLFATTLDVLAEAGIRVTLR
ncbi:barstar family protein [Kitasatospora purpeofusca]|uniref:barstar family protein n=1 Tax=Kitasatospora purpeofusca TaxID=67352 RepID=UPI002A59F705|nr:barstar family protein [Kitasatospora purpeofusca]MDY0812710.1 barstar family protein [Kitasatospora purpeofusca]